MTHERNDGKSNLKDEARTPPELFGKLDAKYRFDIDACCTTENCLCTFGFAIKFQGVLFQNALTLDWMQPNEFEKIPVLYCNPPYSDPTPFIKKAYEESLKGATVVMLLPADTSTKSFHEYVMKADEIIFLKGRVVFNNPDGTPMQGSPKFGSMVVVFDWMQYQPKRVQVRSWDWKNEEL